MVTKWLHFDDKIATKWLQRETGRRRRCGRRRPARLISIRFCLIIMRLKKAKKFPQAQGRGPHLGGAVSSSAMYDPLPSPTAWGLWFTFIYRIALTMRC